MKNRENTLRLVCCTALLFAGMFGPIPGCSSENDFASRKSECLYRCGKCGRAVPKLNSVTDSQSCPQGGTHEWWFNLE